MSDKTGLCVTCMQHWNAEARATAAEAERDEADALNHHLIYGDMARTSNDNWMCGLATCAFHKDNLYRGVPGWGLEAIKERGQMRATEERLQVAVDDAKRLANWLEWLMEWQNGPPLESYKEPWTHGMERGRAALDAHRDTLAALDAAREPCLHLRQWIIPTLTSGTGWCFRCGAINLTGEWTEPDHAGNGKPLDAARDGTPA